MKHDRRPGIKCPDCGCRLVPGEVCDCERLKAEQRTKARRSKTDAIIAHNLEVVERAMRDWDYA